MCSPVSEVDRERMEELLGSGPGAIQGRRAVRSCQEAWKLEKGTTQEDKEATNRRDKTEMDKTPIRKNRRYVNNGLRYNQI